MRSSNTQPKRVPQRGVLLGTILRTGFSPCSGERR